MTNKRDNSNNIIINIHDYFSRFLRDKYPRIFIMCSNRVHKKKMRLNFKVKNIISSQQKNENDFWTIHTTNIIFSYCGRLIKFIDSVTIDIGYNGDQNRSKK